MKNKEWEEKLIAVLGESILTPEQVGEVLPWLHDFIRTLLKKEREKWEKKTIVIPKGKSHPIHDECEDCTYKERQRIRKEYNELILAVESKYKGETRHETALRYIKEAESLTNPDKKGTPNN